jgi:hypothetical protein
MKIYTVYVNKSCSDYLENARFVEEGFSLWAAIFQGFWAVYNRMWLCAAALIVVNICFFALEKYVIMSPNTLSILQMAFFVLVGYEANDWKRVDLEQKGWELFEIVAAKNEIEAQAKFFGDMVSV